MVYSYWQDLLLLCQYVIHSDGDGVTPLDLGLPSFSTCLDAATLTTSRNRPGRGDMKKLSTQVYLKPDDISRRTMRLDLR